MNITLYQVDSFTNHLFSGNPAGVVLNAEDLDDGLMQKIARELNNSETAFIINRSGPEYDIEVRFFTPTREVPICGHATIAAHYVYAIVHGIESGRIIQKTMAGNLPVEIQKSEDGLKVTMTQGKVEFGMRIEGEEKQEILKGLGLSADALDESMPIQIVSTGHSKVLIPVRTPGLLQGITLNNDILSRLSSRIGCNGYFPFTLNPGDNGILAEGRMFAPAIGIQEDPVTGNANGPLGAYLTFYGQLAKSSRGTTFRITQGASVNRKGYMDVTVFCSDDYPDKIKISGNSRIVFQTEINLDDQPGTISPGR